LDFVALLAVKEFIAKVDTCDKGCMEEILAMIEELMDED